MSAMTLNRLLRLLCLWALFGAASGWVQAQTPARVVRIGVLSGSTQASVANQMRQLREGLQEHGYIEGSNLNLLFRYANGELEKLPALASELLGERVDMLFAGGDQAIAAAKAATKTVPIVMVACDAIAAGLVTNLARPGGNLTGVTCLNAELAGKRVEILRDVLPSLARVGLLHNPSEVRVNHEVSETRTMARKIKVASLPLAVMTPQQFAPAFNSATRQKAGAIVIVNNSFTFTYRKQIADLARQHKLPTAANFREYVDAGALLSYGPNLPAMYRQATAHVDKIFKGANPGTLPVEQATRFELVVNLATAKALNLTISQEILLRADALVE